VAPFDTLLFWLGGVLTDSPVDLTLHALDPHLTAQARLRWKPLIDPLAAELALGKRTPDEYCASVAAACEAGVGPQELQEHIRARAAVRQDVLQVIADIPSSYSLWLLRDLPQTWFDAIDGRPALEGYFPAERLLAIAGLGLDSLGPEELFAALPRAVQQPAGRCLVVDADSRRAVGNIRLGLASIIYVYPARLAHELALQKIIAGGVDVMHPSSSERVELL